VGVYEQGISGCVRVLMDVGGRVLVGVASRWTWTDIVCLPQRVAQLAASERRKNTDGEWSRFPMVGYLSDGVSVRPSQLAASERRKNTGSASSSQTRHRSVGIGLSAMVGSVGTQGRSPTCVPTGQKRCGARWPGQ
jgi:hypothetical protein